MLRGLVGWISVGCVLAAAGGGHAQAYDEDGPAPVNTTMSVSAGADPDILPMGNLTGDVVRTDASAAAHRLGTYAGVQPGSASPPPVRAPKDESRPLITWPGFQMKQDGTSRVFLQSTTPLTPLPIATDGKFTVHLPGAKVSGNTNRLPLETRFFNTPVSRVNIDEKKDGVTLVLDMRGDVEPVVSSEKGPAGFYFLYIDLPKGQYVKNAPAVAEAAPAPPAPPRTNAPEEAAKTGGSVKTEASASGRVETSSGSGAAKVKGSASAKGGFSFGR